MRLHEKYNLEDVIKSIRKGEAGFTTLEDMILQAKIDEMNVLQARLTDVDGFNETVHDRLEELQHELNDNRALKNDW